MEFKQYTSSFGNGFYENQDHGHTPDFEKHVTWEDLLEEDDGECKPMDLSPLQPRKFLKAPRTLGTLNASSDNSNFFGVGSLGSVSDQGVKKYISLNNC